MKRLITTTIAALCTIAAMAQTKSSPYIETGSSIVNNTGFKAASIRTVPVTRPTPQHTHTNPVNATFPARFAVAKANTTSNVNWATACGWNSTANSSVSGVSAAIVPTGCAAYFELGALAGTWRVPTQREMSLIVICRLELAAIAGFTALGAGSTYWTSSQVNATQAWAITISGSSMYPRDKTTPLSVRCIRDL